MQLNAHAWAELYFPGYGWVEFEPTAGFSTPGQGPASPEAPALGDDAELPPLPPIPTSLWSRIWPGLLLLAVLSVIVALAVRRERPWSGAARGVPELWAYAQLQENGLQLDSGPRPTQTPAEFGEALTARIDALTRDESGQRRRGWETRFTTIAAGIDDLVRRYARRQYAPTSPADGGAARGQWRRLRGHFWRLRLLRLRHRR
jgi:hypothetical protein